MHKFCHCLHILWTWHYFVTMPWIRYHKQRFAPFGVFHTANKTNIIGTSKKGQTQFLFLEQRPHLKGNYQFRHKIKLENVAIVWHCNLRPPGLPSDPHPPVHTSGKLSCPKTALGPVKVCVKFQPSSYNSFRDMRGSQIYIRRRWTPARCLGEKFSCRKRVLGPVYICVKFQLSTCNSFRDMTGSQLYPSVGC